MKMSLKDERDRLARSKDKQEGEVQNEKQPHENLRGNLKEKQRALSGEVARQNRLKDALSQGEAFYKEALTKTNPRQIESQLLSAKNMFEAALQIEPDSPSAREGLIRVLNAFAAEAEKTRRFKMALDYYQTLERDYDEPTARMHINEVERLIEKDKINRRYTLIGGGIIGILIVGLLLIQSVHLIAWPAEVCNEFGSILCVPTATPTLIPTKTLTPLPTQTLVPTFTPMPTVTPMNTPTPIVYKARLVAEFPLIPVYASPGSAKITKYLSNGDFVYLCAKDAVTVRYLISLDYCFNPVTPLGWINQAYLVLTFDGDVPSAITTPSQ
jgi:hypothetical protein